MIWKKICGMNKIGSMRATLQVLDLLEHILFLRLDKKLVDETGYKIINNYLTEPVYQRMCMRKYVVVSLTRMAISN